jgi:hypothetical protein
MSDRIASDSFHVVGLSVAAALSLFDVRESASFPKSLENERTAQKIENKKLVNLDDFLNSAPFFHLPTPIDDLLFLRLQVFTFSSLPLHPWSLLLSFRLISSPAAGSAWA